MKNLFAQLVGKLVDYHFDDEKRHWEECNPDFIEDSAGIWLDNIPGTSLNRTDRFCVKTQFNGLTACIISISAGKSALLQGDDAGQFLAELTPAVLESDEMFDRMCSEYIDEPDAADPHIFDDLKLLRASSPVTVEKAMADHEITKSLGLLLTYDQDSEADSFASMFGTDVDPSVMTVHEILGYSIGGSGNSIPDAMKHIYQVIRYLENEIKVEALKKAVRDLDGDMSGGRLNRQWFKIKSLALN